MDLKECYLAMAGDYEDAMRRFLKEERIIRFLAMFLKEESYPLLCSAMEAQNYEEVFRAAHTLKGITMNLSLTALLQACTDLTENLRGLKPDGQTEVYFNKLQKEYIRTTKAIETLLL